MARAPFPRRRSGPDSVTLSNGRTFKSVGSTRHVLTEAELWAVTVENGINLLCRFYETRTIHGQKWLDAMKAHYRGRVIALLDDYPHGCKDAADVFRERIHKL